MWEQPQPNQPITDHPVVDFCMKISPFIGAAKFNLLFWVCVAVVPAKKRKHTTTERVNKASKGTLQQRLESRSLSHSPQSVSLAPHTHALRFKPALTCTRQARFEKRDQKGGFASACMNHQPFFVCMCVCVQMSCTRVDGVLFATHRDG